MGYSMDAWQEKRRKEKKIDKQNTKQINKKKERKGKEDESETGFLHVFAVFLAP